MPSSSAMTFALASGSAIAVMAMRNLDGVIFLRLPPTYRYHFWSAFALQSVINLLLIFLIQLGAA